MSQEACGTLNFSIERIGGSFIVRDRRRGEVQAFRPDAESAQKTAENLETSGMYVRGGTIDDFVAACAKGSGIQSGWTQEAFEVWNEALEWAAERCGEVNANACAATIRAGKKTSKK